jgi:hypothetical protein
MTSGAKKNENRFLGSQQNGIKIRTKKIKKIIETLSVSNVFFKNPTQLAKFVAQSINNEIDAVLESQEVEKITVKLKRHEGRIVYGTLLRSLDYKPLIYAFFEKDKKNISENVSMEKMLSLEIDNTELRSNVKALNNFIANQGAQLLTNKAVKASKKESIDLKNEDFLIRLDACYKIIMNLLEQSDHVFIIDEGQIINSAKRYNNVVASKNLIKQSCLFDSQLFGENNE